ncbi:MAG: hypothetical protein K2Z25_11595 [Beijerinckiaceae bacterium]|nr:hypothetical protein [Beijerinckiaceae bacterium]
MNKDPFGFSAANRIAAKIAEVKPDADLLMASSLSAIDRVGEAHGFHSRESGHEKIIRRRREVGPSAQLNVKCPVPVYNRFVRFCDLERLSYWEGIERLLDRADDGGQDRRST